MSGTRGMAAREAALGLLHQVLERRQRLDDALEIAGSLADLAPRDRAFARLLTSTVLRRMGQLDGAIDHCLVRPPSTRTGRIRQILRLGAAQLLFLDTPPHAAIDSAVRLAARQPRFKGLVNAVLRRLVREGPALLAAQDGERLNIPDWLWRAWSATYGDEAARVIAAASLQEAALDITVKKDATAWAERLAAEILPTGGLRRTGGGRVEDLSGYDEGAWWVQDAGAALPVHLLGDVAGRAVLDLCAAPGGKSAQLAAAGAQVTALDASPRRLRRLAENLSRLELAVDTIEADARAWRPPQPAALILLDAPCTATGTIRRHPDILHRRTPQDLARATALQDQLLDAALEMLEPGGTLVYCACSLQLEEGPERIARLLAKGLPIQRQMLVPREVFGRGEWIDENGDLRTLPQQLGGMDGFYACRLRRHDT